MKKANGGWVALALIFIAFAVIIVSNYRLADRYSKMVAQKNEVPMWQADQKPLISKQEFLRTFHEANQKGSKNSQVANKYLAGTVIPGLRGAWSINHKNGKPAFGNDWVPQGITENKDDFFVSLYDGDHQRNSLIMVINKNTGKYVKSLILNSTSHVGGLAYDYRFDRLWWSDDGHKSAGVSYTSLARINHYQATRQNPTIKSSRISLPWASRTSGITYSDNQMVIVKYGRNASERSVVVVELNSKTGLFTKASQVDINYNGKTYEGLFQKMIEDKQIKSIAPGYDRMQGLAISTKGVSLFTQSNGDDNSILWMMQPNKYSGVKFNYSNIKYGPKKVIFPPSIEQVSLNEPDNTALSVIFESGAKKYREEGNIFSRPKIMDRIVTFGVSITGN